MKSYKLYKVASVILLMAVVCVFCGCAKENHGVEQTNKSLTLCVDEYINDTYRDGFEEFRRTYPDVELNVEVYTDLLPGMERVNTQLMAGEGPDLLLMSCYGTTDIYKMMKAHVFAPLDEFMEKDEGWDAKNYAKTVLDAGIYEGKQMVMPLSYIVQVAITSKENLERAGISLDSCNDMAAFLQQTAKFYELDSAERVLGDVGQLTEFSAFLPEQFLDYSKGELGVNEQTLQQACYAYKSFYKEDAVENNAIPVNGYWDIGEAIANGETCMVMPVNGYGFMAASQTVATSASPVLWPRKSGSGQITASIMDYVGIRANSENIQNAWNMIRILMEETSQSSVAEYGQYCPVLTSVSEHAIDQAKVETFEKGKSFVEMVQLPQDLLVQYKDALLNPEKAIFPTDIFGSKFLNYMKPFYEDQGSYEECISEFQKFISIYLTE